MRVVPLAVQTVSPAEFVDGVTTLSRLTFMVSLFAFVFVKVKANVSPSPLKLSLTFDSSCILKDSSC